MIGCPVQNEYRHASTPFDTDPASMKVFVRRHPVGVRVTLYSKAECSLCRDAEEVVKRVFGPRQVNVVDIIGDRRLEDEYIFRIPVLVVSGQVFAEGQITMADARSAHRAALRDQTSGQRT